MVCIVISPTPWCLLFKNAWEEIIAGLNGWQQLTCLTIWLTWTGMSKREHGRQHCPPGSVAAGQPPPVMREPLSGGRRPSPLPEETHREEMCQLRPLTRISLQCLVLPAEKYVTVLSKILLLSTLYIHLYYCMFTRPGGGNCSLLSSLWFFVEFLFLSKLRV